MIIMEINVLLLKMKKKNNPRLQVNSSEEYVKIMDNLKLESPKMMDIAVPANKKGFTLEDYNRSSQS